MDQEKVFLIIVGMAVVTYLPRFLPAWFLSSRPLAPLAEAWLKYVPVSVLAAMLVPSLVIQDGNLDLGLDNIFLIAAIPTLIVAWKTKSLLGSVVAGMGIVAAARYFFGL